MCEYVDCKCTGINNVAVSSQTCKPSRLRHLREKGCPLSRKALILAVASSDCTNKDILQTKFSTLRHLHEHSKKFHDCPSQHTSTST